MTYNPLFDSLCKDDHDLEGLVAYALYKRHKREWADQIRHSANAEPTEDQEKSFVTACSTSSQLGAYRIQAQDLLLEFAEAIVNDERPNIEKRALTVEFENAASDIRKSGSFLQLLKVGVASTLISTGMLALLAVGTDLFGIDLVDALGMASGANG